MIRKFTLSCLFVLYSLFASAQILYEGFEGGVIPDTWKVIDANNDGKTWRSVTFTPFSGSRCVELDKGWSSTPNDWLITPKFTVTEGCVLSFYCKSLSDDTPGSFKVFVSKGEREIFSYTIEIANEPVVKKDWKQFVYQISANAEINVGDEISVAIYAGADCASKLRIDDFTVEVPPTAPKPVLDISEADISSEQSISISSGYVFNLRNAGLDGLQIAEVSGFDGTIFKSTLTTASSASVNLKRNESISFAVSFTPQEVKEYTGILNIKTNAGDVALKINGTGVSKTDAVDAFTLDFETASEANPLPSNWYTFDVNNSNTNWIYESTDTYQDSNGALKGNRNAAVDNNLWLVTPRIKVEEGMIFNFFARSTTTISFLGGRENFKVLLSKNGKDFINDFNITVSEENKPGSTYTEFSYDLSAISGVNVGDEVFVAIVDVSAKFNGAGLFIDDIKLQTPEIDPVTINKLDWSANTTAGVAVNSGDIFTITNNTAEEIAITNITDLAGSVFSTTLVKDSKIAASGSTSFGFSYSPVAGGDHAKTFVIETSKGNITIELTGKAVGQLPEGVSLIEENFEESSIPSAWEIIDANNDSNTWVLTKFTVQSHDSHNAMKISQITDVHNDYLVLPLFKVSEGSKFKFWLKSQFANDIINIVASKTGHSASDFNIELVKNHSSLLEWTEMEIDLTANENINVNDNIYLAIHVVSPANNGFMKGQLAIDDVFVGSTSSSLSNESLIKTFTVANQVGESVISGNTIKVTMPAGTNLKAITPTITISDKATVVPASGSVVDFSAGAINFTVTAEDKTTTVYSVSVVNQAAALSNESLIKTFTVANQIGETIIDNSAKTVKVVMAADADLKTVTPTITISDKATVAPASGSVVDFSGGVVDFTVTAEDGTKSIYKVTVEKQSVPVQEGQLGLFEGFEGNETALPRGWKMIDKDGNGQAWFVVGNAKFEGEYGIKTKRNMTGNNDWLITPRVKVRDNDYLTFMARSSAALHKENFNVLVSKAGTSVEDFTITVDQVIEASDDLGFTEYKYRLQDISGINVGDNIHIAIQVVSDDKSELHVDNISVNPPPVNPIAAVNKTEWREVTRVGETEKSFEFTLTNTLAGTLNVTEIKGLTGTPFTTSIVAADVNLAKDETYKFTIDFTPTTAGDFNQPMVIKTNGGDIVINLKAYAYDKNCYHQEFEVEADYANWITIDNDEDGHNWFPYQNTDYAPDLAHTGKFCIVSESALLDGGPANPDNWIVSPKLAVNDNDKLVFWAGAVSDISFKEHFAVLLSTKTKRLTDFTEVLIKDQILTTHKYTKVEIDLSAYKGKKVYVAIIHRNISDESQLLIDDIITPALHVPVDPDMLVEAVPAVYTKVPLSQASINFVADVSNQGTALENATDISFSVIGTDYNNLVALNVPFANGVKESYKTTSPFVADKKGVYEMLTKIDLANDEEASDNFSKISFEVVDSVMAREDGIPTNNTKTPVDKGGELGQIFEFVKKDTISSISIQLASPVDYGDQSYPTEESTIKFRIYKYDGGVGEMLCETDEYTVETTKFQWHTIPLYDKLIVKPGKYLIAVVDKEGQSLKVCITKNFFAKESVFMNTGDVWKPLEQFTSMKFTYMIRANVNAGKKYNVIDNPDLVVKSVGVEYPILPFQQAHYNFAASIFNKGTILENKVNVSFVVENSPYNENGVLEAPLARGVTKIASVTNAFIAKHKGVFKVTANAKLDNDEYPNNNINSASFEVVDTVMARETGNVTKALTTLADADLSFGQVFEFASADKVKSVSLHLSAPVNAEGKIVPLESDLKFRIYKYEGTRPTEMIYESKEFNVTMSETAWKTFVFDAPVDVEKGKYLFNVVDKVGKQFMISYTTEFNYNNSVFIGNNTGAWFAVEDLLKKNLTFMYRVNVVQRSVVFSNESLIKSFTIANQIGETVIDNTAKTVKVVMTKGTDLTSLAPSVTVSDNATVAPNSGATVDFSKGAVNYTVTAEDESTSVYSVTVEDTHEKVTAIDDVNKLQIQVYPNPAKNIVNINTEIGAQITIVNQYGKTIYNTIATDEVTKVDVSNYVPGICFVKVYCKGKQAINKLIVM
ncbi:MAG: choice-of-anchor J domain-containing protein [Bacteroidales bacterium]|nr:choice-of-anchor J domain-containing protein [Bacteroidales bacterium]